MFLSSSDYTTSSGYFKPAKKAKYFTIPQI